jgi:single-strand DNA-binding protein
MNKLDMIGNLVKDWELKYLPNGTALATNTIAVTDGFGDNEKTFFFDLKAFGKTAENLNNFFKKGEKIAISGKITQETWEKDGKKNSKVVVFVSEFYFITSKSESKTRAQPPAKQPAPQNQRPAPRQLPPAEAYEDSIPF